MKRLASLIVAFIIATLLAGSVRAEDSGETSSAQGGKADSSAASGKNDKKGGDKDKGTKTGKDDKGSGDAGAKTDKPADKPAPAAPATSCYQKQNVFIEDDGFGGHFEEVSVCVCAECQ